MTLYRFGPFVAYDPTTGELVRGGIGLVYGVDDLEFATPLPVQSLNGETMSSIETTAIGIGEEFMVEDNAELNWKSGDYVIKIVSFQSLLEAAQLAQQAADDSAASAALSAEGAAPNGGLTGQVLGKLSNTDRDIGWINGGGGGGSGSGIIVVTDVDDIPAGTPAGTIIARVSGAPVPVDVDFPTGVGNVTVGGDGSSDTLALLVLPVPSSAMVGDVLFAVFASQNTATTDRLWSVPAGWTLESYPTSGRKMGLATYPIVDSAALAALGSEQTFTLANTATNRCAGLMCRGVNVDLADPIVGVSTWSSDGTNATYSTPSFTSTASAGALLTLLTTNNSAGTVGTTKPVATQAGFGLVGSYYQETSDISNGNTAVHLLSRVATGTAHPLISGSLTPTSSASVISAQFAVKKAA